MTINLANNNPRIEYSVAQGVTQQTFAVPFEFFDDGDLSVYVDGVLKAEGTDYTTTGGDGSTGTVVFVTATPPDVQQVTGATGGSQVVIVRNIPIERTSDFSAGSDINRAALNEQLDILTAMLADLKSKIDRSLTLIDYDVVNYQLTIPPTSQRLNKYLAFGADGNLTTTDGTTSNIVVSSFGQNLVDDVNAAAALQTLGLTATATELNILDGATVSTAEVNYLSGVTSGIQAQINSAVSSGAIMFFAMSSAPTGWLKANGANVSRTAYANLFSAIGTTFGAGDGSTTFTLPDLRGEFVRSWDDGRGVDTSRVFGSAQAAAMLNHTHTGTTSTDGAHTHTVSSYIGTGGGTGGFSSTASFTTVTTSSAGSHSHTMTTGNPSAGGGTETRPRNIALLACIKF